MSRYKILLLLLTVNIVLALLIVDFRQQDRRLFSELQSLKTERDALNIEWGQLLLEEGAWSQHVRVEKLAVSKLSMQTPQKQQVFIVKLSDEKEDEN